MALVDGKSTEAEESRYENANWQCQKLFIQISRFVSSYLPLSFRAVLPFTAGMLPFNPEFGGSPYYLSALFLHFPAQHFIH
jgi:hypothetical protein